MIRLRFARNKISVAVADVNTRPLKASDSYTSDHNGLLIRTPEDKASDFIREIMKSLRA